MDAIDVGILSILPPLIAIILALVTKEVISSLLIGILSGTLIYSVNTGGGFMGFFDSTLTLMLDKMGDNASIILFLAFLGALVAIVTKAGGSRAYGAWAAKKVKNRSGALYATSALGVLIFVDDYFNCLTVGTVMRPVTDKFKVSRAKLAYIIDSTAAPVCIIAPISSWAASVISQMEGTGLNGMQAFVQSIPYNLYALLSIAMVFALTALKKDFGPMAKHENAADKSFAAKAVAEDDFAAVKPSDRGRVIDLVLPVVALIVICVLSMLYVGGYFDGGMTLAEGFGETDAGVALALGGFLTLILTFLFLVPRKVGARRIPHAYLDIPFLGAAQGPALPRFYGEHRRGHKGHGARVHHTGAGVDNQRRLPRPVKHRRIRRRTGGKLQHARRGYPRDSVRGGLLPQLLNRHLMGHVRHTDPHCRGHLPERRPRPDDNIPRGHARGRGVRRPLLADLRHDNPVVNRRRLRPHDPRIHTDTIFHNRRRMLLCRIHRRGLYAERVRNAARVGRAARGYAVRVMR